MQIVETTAPADASMLIDLFDLSDDCAAAVVSAYGLKGVSLPGQRIPVLGSIVEPLLDLGILQQSHAGPVPVPRAEAEEAGWAWRERQADELVAQRDWEAEAHLAHFLGLARAAGCDIQQVKPLDEEDWYVRTLSSVRRVTSAAPPMPRNAVRQRADWKGLLAQDLAGLGRVNVCMQSVNDAARLAQYGERNLQSGMAKSLKPYSLFEGQVALRMAVLDDDVTLVPTAAQVGDGITVIRSKEVATAAVRFMLRSARAVETSEQPVVDGACRSVLRLLATGATDDVIARRLAVSDRTVRRTVSSLMALLGAESRFQLALRASRAGLL